MRATLTLLMSAAILCGAAMAVQAQESGREGNPPKRQMKKPPDKAERVAIAKLQIKMHRTTADLIEAQIEEKPDTEKIGKIQKELRAIQAEMRKLMPAPPAGRPGQGQGSRRRGGPGPGGDDGFGPGMMGPPGGMGPGFGGPGGPDDGNRPDRPEDDLED